jgi:hypothetical protein
MSGQWPPDWEDPDDVDAEAEQATAEADVRQVTAFLAALPDPVMPEAVEARISAAIAAAAADRAEADEISGARIGGRTLGRPPRRAKVRRPKDRQPKDRRPKDRQPKDRQPKDRQRRRFGLQAITAVAACLVIAGFGFLLTRLGGSSATSSGADVAGAPAASSAPQAHAANGQPANGQNTPVPAEALPSTRFTVTAHGDVYQKSTLVSQVRQRLRELGGAAQPFSSSVAPSSALAGCVLHVTGDTVPSLVDEATYAGKPVYVIAVSSRAWVVGRGCTATDPQLITTVSLAGLRGNLSVLGSVEG